MCCACSSETQRLSDMQEYEGPMYESENVRILLSDSTVVKVEMLGKRQVQYQNGDIEFPEGLHLIFYDKEGQKITELTAQKGYKASKENMYRAEGDVLVKNLNKKETLSTELLFWDPKEEIIYTNQFVTIETETELLPAEGFSAPQDFSTYELIKPRNAIIKINEN